MPTLDDARMRGLALFRDRCRPRPAGAAECRRGAGPGVRVPRWRPVGVLDRERHDRAMMLPRGRGRLEIAGRGSGPGELRAAHRRAQGPDRSGPPRHDELTDWSACVIDLDNVPQLWDSAGLTPDAPGVGPTAWRAGFDVGRAGRPLPVHRCLGQGLCLGQRLLPRPLLAPRTARKRSTFQARYCDPAATNSSYWNSTSWPTPSRTSSPGLHWDRSSSNPATEATVHTRHRRLMPPCGRPPSVRSLLLANAFRPPGPFTR